VVDYNGYHLNRDLWKKGYSFYLQSEAADHTNQLGIKAGYRWIVQHNARTRLNMQVHDEVVASCPLNGMDESYAFVKYLVQSLETPRVVMGHTLVVPACLTVARSWDSKDGYEFERFPTYKQFVKGVEGIMYA
jgi:hypothetical protein